MRSMTVPAGTYVLGDPCYSVPDDLWDELLDSADYFDSKMQGTVAGFTVYAFGTRWGDGLYRSSGGKEFPVDAGLIGLVPTALMAKFGKEPEPDAVIVTFNGPTLIGDDEGVLQFGGIVIDTAGGDTDEEDWS